MEGKVCGAGGKGDMDCLRGGGGVVGVTAVKLRCPPPRLVVLLVRGGRRRSGGGWMVVGGKGCLEDVLPY